MCRASAAESLGGGSLRECRRVLKAEAGREPAAPLSLSSRFTPSLSHSFTHRTESAMTYWPGVPWLSRTTV